MLTAGASPLRNFKSMLYSIADIIAVFLLIGSTFTIWIAGKSLHRGNTRPRVSRLLGAIALTHGELFQSGIQFEDHENRDASGKFSKFFTIRNLTGLFVERTIVGIVIVIWLSHGSITKRLEQQPEDVIGQTIPPYFPMSSSRSHRRSPPRKTAPKNFKPASTRGAKSRIQRKIAQLGRTS